MPARPGRRRRPPLDGGPGAGPGGKRSGGQREFIAPLARAAMGGLAVSTVLTLVLVPALYEWFYTRRDVNR